jgi:hypothetical protein
MALQPQLTVIIIVVNLVAFMAGKKKVQHENILK